MHYGERLKQERNRLELTQHAMAEACGVSKRQQINYEGGNQWPGGAYLAAAIGVGVDVVYVLTGQRAGHVDTSEAKLLAAYRNATDEARAMVMAALGAALAPKRRESSPATVGAIKAKRIGQALSGQIDQTNVHIDMGQKKGEVSLIKLHVCGRCIPLSPACFETIMPGCTNE